MRVRTLADLDLLMGPALNIKPIPQKPKLNFTLLEIVVIAGIGYLLIKGIEKVMNERTKKRLSTAI